jgi:hypothetical protein
MRQLKGMVGRSDRPPYCNSPRPGRPVRRLQLTEVVNAEAALVRTALHVVDLVLAVAVRMIGTLAAQQTMGSSWRTGDDQQETTSWSPTAPS